MKDNEKYLELTTWSADEASRRDKADAGPVPTLTLVAHPHLARIGERYQWHDWRRNGPLALSRIEPLFAPVGRSLGDPLALPSLSRKPIRLHREADGLIIERGDHRRDVWIDGAPLTDRRRIARSELEKGVAIDLARRALLLLHISRPLAGAGHSLPGMIGQSDAIQRLCRETQDLAGVNLPVLIRGETGTGKELVAQALHRLSARARKPFISVNMAALTENLAAAELFGSERGAYSGADRARLGYLRAAHGGALFLDEIGEAPLSVQAALLRALETREVTPVGGHGALRVDFRLICATDADLESRIAAGSFKEPLYHRIAAAELAVPSLRERREDLGPLFLHFAQQARSELGLEGLPDHPEAHAGPWLPTELAARLLAFSWPGNVRQFRNAVQDLVVAGARQSKLAATPRLLRMLDAEPEPEPTQLDEDVPSIEAPAKKPRQIEEAALLEAMAACAWEPKLAAARLGVSRASVYNLIRKSDKLKTAIDLSPEEISAAHEACDGDLEAMATALKVSKLALERRLRAMSLR